MIPMKAISIGSALLLGALVLLEGTARADVLIVPAGKSLFPEPQKGAIIKPEDVAKLLQNDGEAASASLEGKTFRLKGQVKDFTTDHPLNREHDLFVILTDSQAPWQTYLRIRHDQLEKNLCLPEDKRPPMEDTRYATFKRVINQGHTVPYFDTDKNCIGLHYSEDFHPPEAVASGKPAASTTPKQTRFPTSSSDKAVLLSVGDNVDVQASFEVLAAGNIAIFDLQGAAAKPPAK